MRNREVRLFNNCIPVKGYSRSIIQNLMVEGFHIVPFSFVAYINGFSYDLPNDIKQEYISFFKKNNLGYFENKCVEEKISSKMNISFDFPSKISNLVLFANHLFQIQANVINKLNIYALLIVIDIKIDSQKLGELFFNIGSTSIASVQIVILDDAFVDFEAIKKVFSSYSQIQKVICYSKDNAMEKSISGRIFRTTNSIIELCGDINKHSLFAGCNFFCESQHHNTCLNRKLCIDKDGYIKNCPYMEQHFGHISNTNIEDVVKLHEFQKWWHIKKDDIDVCKDCEFRHMCTDCRAFIKDPGNIYSQPAKCTYNPYVCKWEGEDGYVPVEECGTYSRETGFVPDKKKIKKLNKAIWGDE